MNIDILRGEVWLLDLNPALGREQSGTRPALIVSDNIFNRGPADLAIVVPITSKDKNVRSHVRIPKGEAGLSLDSYAKCEDIRSVSKQRFMRRFGSVDEKTMRSIEDILRFLMRL